MPSPTEEALERAELMEEALELRHAVGEKFRNGTAICVAALAILLAISSFFSASYVRELINTNIHANSDETLVHVKKVEQTSDRLAADELRVSLEVDRKLLGPGDKALLQKEIRRYESEAARLESDPKTGEGQKELQASMQRWETKHHEAEEHLISFESADITFQVAIVLCSICIVLQSRRLLQLALTVGAGAAFLLLNGFFLWARL